jgi:hypothetical protein
VRLANRQGGSAKIVEKPPTILGKGAGLCSERGDFCLHELMIKKKDLLKDLYVIGYTT